MLMDMSEKSYLYILMQGEAIVISSQKQFNTMLTKEMARNKQPEESVES